MIHTPFCPECGPVPVDEDGCCSDCGATAVGTAMDGLLTRYERLRAKVKRTGKRQVMWAVVTDEGKIVDLYFRRTDADDSVWTDGDYVHKAYVTLAPKRRAKRRKR